MPRACCVGEEEGWDYAWKGPEKAFRIVARKLSPLRVSSQGLDNHLGGGCPTRGGMKRGWEMFCCSPSTATRPPPKFSPGDASGPSSTEADSGGQ